MGPVSSDRPSRVPEFGRPDAQEFAIGKQTHRVADVDPLDVSGVRTMIFGTALWGIVAIGMLPFWSTLRDTGRTWWLWTAFAGFGLGLLGLEYCRTRLHALQDATGPSDTNVPATKKGFRLPSRNSASKRLMEVSKAQSRAADERTPEKSSLTRKYGLLSQTTDEIPRISDAELGGSTAEGTENPSSATRIAAESQSIPKTAGSLAERIAAGSAAERTTVEAPAAEPPASEAAPPTVGRRRKPVSYDD